MESSSGPVLTRLLSVSIAVPDVASVLPAYVDQLGLRQLGGTIESKRFPMNWVELTAGDATYPMVELLEATGPGPVASFLEQRPAGVYQVRFGVASMPEAVAELRRRGLHVIEGERVEGHPDISWIHPRETGGVLIELLEDPDGC